MKMPFEITLAAEPDWDSARGREKKGGVPTELLEVLGQAWKDKRVRQVTIPDEDVETLHRHLRRGAHELGFTASVRKVEYQPGYTTVYFRAVPRIYRPRNK